MKSYAVFASALVIASVSACSPPAAKAPPAPPPPDVAAIRAGLETEVAKLAPIFEKKDVPGAVAMFTPDATWILQDASTFTGTSAITTAIKGVFDSYGSMTADPAVIDKLIVVSDSEAVTFSHETYTQTLKGSKKAEHHNNPFADDWKKGADGTWRIAYEVNADGQVAEKKP